MNADRVGLSYVATWMLVFSVLVPARPREALVALALSALAVPVVYLQQMGAGHAPRLAPEPFATLFVWPYLACAAASYVAARIVHQLGVEVRRTQELGGYRLESLLGRGGMGEVWRASHHTLARPAAIKVIRADALGHDPIRALSAIARFEAEAQAIAQLQSPHTVELYDFGTTDDGTVFYVMELLDGVDLEALVRRDGPLPPGRVVHILRQVCASLSEAHARGLVHRDVKPANIFLCRRAMEYDVVKVLDFGLATALAELGHHRRDAEPLMGTPDYMAPETTTGAGVDARTDLYAVGCVAFWLLTSRVVFPANTIVAALDSDRHAVPEAPSRVAPAQAVPASLDALVLRCLSKSPSDRPPSASALGAELDALAASLPWGRDDARACWPPRIASVPDELVTRPVVGAARTRP